MEVQFTKFLDIKSPIGAYQLEQEGEFSPVGVDIYFPRPGRAFFDALITANKNLHIDNYDIHTHECSIYDNINELQFGYDAERKQYIIYTNKIQIPTGLGILIPLDYHIDLRSKSSNFKNGYTEVTGLIDADYTFGFGVQIINITENNSRICFHPDEKFAQLVLRKTHFIDKMTEIPLDEWENDERILRRRKTRTGGFGHTGKF
jgi:dUTPase